MMAGGGLCNPAASSLCAIMSIGLHTLVLQGALPDGYFTTDVIGGVSSFLHLCFSKHYPEILPMP